MSLYMNLLKSSLRGIVFANSIALTNSFVSKSFIKMVAELAGAIGVSICVEGIESREQYKVLEGMNVRLVQGFYFDRPMPKSEFEKKYVNFSNKGTKSNIK